jgi:hypothetical protein
MNKGRSLRNCLILKTHAKSKGRCGFTKSSYRIVTLKCGKKLLQLISLWKRRVAYLPKVTHTSTRHNFFHETSKITFCIAFLFHGSNPDYPVLKGSHLHIPDQFTLCVNYERPIQRFDIQAGFFQFRQ